jgi:alkylation response protein AidB-like acyl-CoA dehydrogenase
MLPIGPEGRPVPAFTLVPKADYKIDWESWRPVGLGGTGSFDVIVENAFVPDYRVLRFSDAVGSTAPGAESNKNPLYRISLLTGVAFALAMPAVGAASGSLERFIDENKVRQTHGAVVLGGKKIADFQTIQKRVGEAAARIDALLDAGCSRGTRSMPQSSRFGTMANRPWQFGFSVGVLNRLSRMRLRQR